MEHFDKHVLYVDNRRRTAAIEEVIAYAEKDLDCGGSDVEYHICHRGDWVTVAAEDALVVCSAELAWVNERMQEQHLVYRQSRRTKRDWETFLVGVRLLF